MAARFWFELTQCSKLLFLSQMKCLKKSRLCLAFYFNFKLNNFNFSLNEVFGVYLAEFTLYKLSSEKFH